LIVVAHAILHSKDNCAATLTAPVTLERVGDIEFEWAESSLIYSKILSVAPRLRKEVGRADGKNDASA
jgi:hypothetical protein